MKTGEINYDETSADATEEQLTLLRQLCVKEKDLRELTAEAAEELIQSLRSMREAALRSAAMV
jgi:hypothetical protein